MQYRNFITAPRESVNSAEPKSFSYYKSGVRVKFPKKSPPARLQILPAYSQANPADSTGFSPCVVNGAPTAWFGMIQAAKFVGHGDWKSTYPILSLASFEGSEKCPYLRVLAYCKQNKDWSYLVTKTGRFGSPDYKDAVLKPVKSTLLLNVVDVDNPGNGVQIAELSYSVANCLLNQETGIVFQRNLQLDNYPNAEAALAADPMLAYANGDITDPAKAPVFIVELPPVKAGQFGAGYTARIEVAGGHVSRRTASPVELASRYHLDDPESFLNIPTGQEIVDRLTMILKGHKNANGVDETCLLKEAVGDTYRVETVSAPGAVNTVSGWSLPPETVEAPVYKQAQPTQPTQPTPKPQPTQPTQSTQSTGFAPNPAVAAASVAPQATQASQASQSGLRMAIPGELPPGGEAELATTLADRLRSQLNMRK